MDHLGFVPRSEGSDYGTLCLVVESISSEQPEIHRVYYPMSCIIHKRDIEHMLNWQVLHHTSYGFVFVVGDSSILTTMQLRDGGATRGLVTEVIPIPPPKTRLSVEWRRDDRAWYKNTTRGWVRA